jgi:hypothetical protein
MQHWFEGALWNYSLLCIHIENHDMKKLILVIGLTQALSLSAQEMNEIEISTEVKKVSVFFENAQIIRQKKVTVQAGKTILKFVNLSPYIQAKSVQAKVNGDVTVQMVNHQLNYLDNLVKSEELIKLESSYHSLEDEIKVEQAHISVIDEEIIFLQENRNIGGKNQELSVANLKEASQFYSSRLTALKLERIERQKRVMDLDMKLQNLRNQMNSLYTKKEFPSGEVLISVDSKHAESISIELSYLVDNAGWYPSYDVRANSIEDPLEIIYKANVHQDTKVDWENVELIFSSSNPGLSGSAPELLTYFLNYGSVPPSYKASINEVSGKVMDSQGNPMPGTNVVVEGTTIGTISDMNGYFSIAIPSGASRLMFSFIGYLSQEIPIQQAEITVFMEEDITSLDEVVVSGYGVSDYESAAPVPRRSMSPVTPVKKRETGSLALPTVKLENQTTVEFRIDMPYTVKSDSRNYVVNMTAYEVPASYEYYCVPKIDKDAFLLGYVTDWEQYKLLEGEANIFFEDTYIGKSILDVRFIKDTLSVSLGRDKGVVVNREKIKDLTSQKLIGAKKEETRAWRISVRNNKSQDIKMVLLDQVPVPTLDEIEVDIKEASRGKRNEETGEIKWKLELDSEESEEIVLRYAVKYPKNRSLIFE